MTFVENWHQIITQGNYAALIHFLKKLDDTGKKKLIPFLKDVSKEYLDYSEQYIYNKRIYDKKEIEIQETLINYTILVCAEKKHRSLHKCLLPFIVVHPQTIEDIYIWYCPTWLTAYLNDFASKILLSDALRYEAVLNMQEKGYIKASKILIARLFPMIIFEAKATEAAKYIFKPNNLLKHPQTLEEHLWYLFDYHSYIYNCERSLQFAQAKLPGKDTWHYYLKIFADEGKIDRKRLLSASIQASTKRFNKRAISWFLHLFEYIKPSKDELIAIQNALLSTCRTSYKHSQKTALKYIKKIALEADFCNQCFLEQASTLIISNTKSIINDTLTILDKLASKPQIEPSKIVSVLVHIFKHRDAQLQERAAKILLKHTTHLANEKLNIPAAYQANLFTTTKKLLKDHLPIALNSIVIPEVHIPIAKKYLLTKKAEIPTIQNLAAFIKFTDKVLDNEEEHHFDLFLAALLKFHTSFQADTLLQLIPILKKAKDLVFNNIPPRTGMLDNMLSIFIIDFINLFISKHPEYRAVLESSKITESLIHPFDLLSNKNDRPTFSLEQWYNPYDPAQIYLPIKKVLLQVLDFIQKDIDLPLLSTATHQPSWVDPCTFIERLTVYQAQNSLPNDMDLQIAISRIAFEKTNTALNLAKQKLKGAYLELATFILTENKELPTSIKSFFEKDFSEATTIEAIITQTPFFNAYLTAYLTKQVVASNNNLTDLAFLNIPNSYFNGQHPWMLFWERRRNLEYNYRTQKVEFMGRPFLYAEIQVKFPIKLEAIDNPTFLYQYIPGNKIEFRPNFDDVPRLLGLIPNNPAPLLALLLSDNLKYFNAFDEDSKKRVVKTLQYLKHIWHRPYQEMVHLFLGLSMLWEDKTGRILAADIWKTAVLQRNIDNSILGTLIGRIEVNEYAPLKRFTDLIESHLLKISPIHDRDLETLIAHLISKLPAIPIKNTKKLLEIYHELLISNHSTIQAPRIKILFALWQERPGLTKVICQLKQYFKVLEQ